MKTERNRQLVADLAAEWGTIRLLLDGEDVVLAGQLNELQRAVALAKDPGDVDDLVFDLLDLLEETPAAEYVRRVLGRSSDLDDVKLKSAAAVDGAVEVVEGISDRADHRTLAAEMSLQLQPLTMMLHFGTNRAGAHNEFTTDVGKRLRFGSLVVTIPVVALETATADAGTRNQWWNPFDNPDPKRHITSADPNELDRPEQLLSSLQAAGNEVHRTRSWSPSMASMSDSMRRHGVWPSSASTLDSKARRRSSHDRRSENYSAIPQTKTGRNRLRVRSSSSFRSSSVSTTRCTCWRTAWAIGSS